MIASDTADQVGIKKLTDLTIIDLIIVNDQTRHIIFLFGTWRKKRQPKHARYNVFANAARNKILKNLYFRENWESRYWIIITLLRAKEIDEIGGSSCNLKKLLDDIYIFLQVSSAPCLNLIISCVPVILILQLIPSIYKILVFPINSLLIT